MKTATRVILVLLGLAAVVAGGVYLWFNRPWRVVVEVNGHVMTAGELHARGAGLLEDAKKVEQLPPEVKVEVNGHVMTAGELHARGAGLLEDAKRVEHLVVPTNSAKMAEAQHYYEEKAAQLWVFKVLMLDEALARKLKATPAEAQEAVKLMEKRLKSRNMTVEDYFKRGPLPEELLRREFEESVLVTKLLKQEVADKIVLKPDEITKHQDELQRWAATTKKMQPEKIDRKFAGDSLRALRYREGVKKFYESLRAKADVKAPEYPMVEEFVPSADPAAPQGPQGEKEPAK